MYTIYGEWHAIKRIRKCVSVKGRVGLFFLCLCLLLSCCGVAGAEDTLKFDSSREIIEYLDEAGLKYSLGDGAEAYDVLTIGYSPDKCEQLDMVVVQVYMYESHASIIASALSQPDTSDMHKLYQNLEGLNDSTSFVRFLYNANNDCIYPQVDVPYVEDAEFGHMVERYMYITAVIVDQNYDGMTVLFQ